MSFLRVNLSLRDKFILGFLVVVCFTGFTTSLAGRYLINKMVIAEAQKRVRSDLNAAWGIYNQLLNNIGSKIKITAYRFFLKENLRKSNLEHIRKELNRVRKMEGLDFLFLTDSEGKIIYRAHNPEREGDDFPQNPLIQYGLKKETLQTSFIISVEELEKEGETILKQANIPTIPIPGEEPFSEAPKASALAMGAGAPIFDDNGNLIGVLAGGILLNGNYALVDTIKEIVFEKEEYKGKEIGNVTLFLGDRRIATNILDNQGNRAVGTRLSREAYNQVLHAGNHVLERNIIIHSWYITSYKLIKDVSGRAIGVIGVGILEERYEDMKDGVVEFFWALNSLAMILALIVSFILTRNITNPVKSLAQKAEKIGKGEFMQIDITSRDEIGQFATTFNQMSSSLKDRDERLKVQTLELLRIKEELEKTNSDLVNQSKELRRSLKELSVLFEASKKVSSSLSLSEIMDAIMDLLMDKFKTDTWSIRLLDEDGYLRIKSQRGLSAEFVKFAERRATMDSNSGECFLTNKIIIVEDAEKITKPISTNLEVGEGIKSFGLVPIAVENEVLGVLAGASKKEKGYFTEDYSEFMKTLGHQMALAIRNARLYEKVKNFSLELEREVDKRTEELREKSRLLAQSEKLAALGEMADRVAHETRNPIVTIGGFARRIKRKLPPHEPLSKYVDIIIEEVERLEKRVYWVTEYKKYISADFETTNINKILERALEGLGDKIEERNITVKKDLPPDPPLVRVNRKNMEFVFLNLLKNGIESMENHGVLLVATRVEKDNYLEIIVSDTGKGIAEEELKSIYDPFFTSKTSGAGMGLTIAHKIVKDHNGSINVRSKKGEGTTFTVELPIFNETG